jgi:hypothetical protein
MKTGHCKKCPKYDCCVEICGIVAADLYRIEHGRKKHRIKIIYEHQLDGVALATYNNIVYSGIQGEARDE